MCIFRAIAHIAVYFSIGFSQYCRAEGCKKILSYFRQNGVTNGKEFRENFASPPDVLTLRIKKFFFQKILTGEKQFEYRERSVTNDKLILAAMSRHAGFLRLHFQDNDIQLLAKIEAIDTVSGEQAYEKWDAEQGIAMSTKSHWRIKISSPQLIWDNEKSRNF